MAPPTHHRGASGRSCCSRKSLFVWSFAIFTVSLIVVNVSFASAYKSMQGLGNYVYSSVNSRTVLQLDVTNLTGDQDVPTTIEMTSVDRADLEQLPNATDSNAAAAAAAGGTDSAGALANAADFSAAADQQTSAKQQAAATSATQPEQQPQPTQPQPSDSQPAAQQQAQAVAAPPPPPPPPPKQPTVVGPPKPRERTSNTLVVYVFQNKDAEAVANFEYFLANGIVDYEDDVDYVIVVQNLQAEKFTPADLPVQVVVEEWPDCTAPWAVYSWALERYDAPTYQHYVLLTSAMAGPYLPPYLPNYRWTDAFTSRLVNGVKMVGPMVSCQSIVRGGDGNSGDWRSNPHVTQEAVVVDREALDLIRKSPEVMRCYENPFDAKYFGESGAARAVLDAGHNLDCLMMKYQGVDWRDKANWGCLSGIRPTVDLVYDGVFVNPLETVFVEVNLGFVKNEFPQAKLARKYAAWQVEKDPIKNEWQDNHWPVKAPRLAVTNARGPGCFDNNFYRKHNPDLAALGWQPWQLWEHFITAGQFQGRPFRFSCDMMVGESYMISYFKHRGPGCFDFKFYKEQNPDVDYMDDKTLWHHFSGMGQFEPRDFRFNCNVDFIMAGQQLPPGGLNITLQENATAMALAEKAKQAAATAAVTTLL